MVKNKKEYKPYPVKDWDHLIVLLEDVYAKDYGLTPTEALECISRHFQKHENAQYYWKLLRINLYLKQRVLDCRQGFIKLGKEKGKFKTPEEGKKKLKEFCGKKNKRIDSVRRTVESEEFAKYFKIYNRKRIIRLEAAGEKILKGYHLHREIIQLNKLICSKREKHLFDKKHHETQKGLFDKQIYIYLLR